MNLKKLDNKYFIYELIDPRTDETKYIGKTINLEERLKGHINEYKSNKTTLKINWIKSLEKKGLIPIINVIDTDEVNFWEIFYIQLYKSWNINLTNMTIGGTGGDTYTNNPNYEDICKRKSISMIGKNSGDKNGSKKVKDKISKTLKSLWETKEYRESQSKSLTGRKCKPKTKQQKKNSSESIKNWWINRRKISDNENKTSKET